METTVDLDKLSAGELQELVKQVRKKEAEARNHQRDAYEALKKDTLLSIKDRLNALTEQTKCFRSFLVDETHTFYGVMQEYSMLKREEQDSFSIVSDNFKVEVKFNKSKGFDERADTAASRLIDYLRAWIDTSNNGGKNPIYKLAMMLIERNKQGELDYKSISKLYELEAEFADEEYNEIMQLFKESNLVERTKYYYNFYEMTPYGGWKKIEPSFNKL